MGSNPFLVRSLKAALSQFLDAPATGGHIQNHHLITEVMGARGVNAPDLATYDGVRGRYVRKGGPVIDTFAKAFNACWHGSRDWREFDLVTLQETHPDFQHLGLPESVMTAMEDAEWAEHYAESR